MDFLNQKKLPFYENKEYNLLPLVEKFITYSYNGKRLNPYGRTKGIN